MEDPAINMSLTGRHSGESDVTRPGAGAVKPGRDREEAGLLGWQGGQSLSKEWGP